MPVRFWRAAARWLILKEFPARLPVLGSSQFWAAASFGQQAAASFGQQAAASFGQQAAASWPWCYHGARLPAILREGQFAEGQAVCCDTTRLAGAAAPCTPSIALRLAQIEQASQSECPGTD